MTRRVLIIDDDEDIRELAKMALETTTGWTVETRADGPSGVQAAREDPPDAVLLDYMMPGTDGITTLGEFKKHEGTRQVPVVVFTAKSESGLADRLRKAGAVGHVVKPFDPMKLAKILEGLLGWNGDE